MSASLSSDVGHLSFAVMCARGAAMLNPRKLMPAQQAVFTSSFFS